MLRKIAAGLLLAASLAAKPALADERAFDVALDEFRQLHRAELRRSAIAGSSFYFVRDGRTEGASPPLIDRRPLGTTNASPRHAAIDEPGGSQPPHAASPRLPVRHAI